MIEAGGTFQPDQEISWKTLHTWLTRLKMPASDGLLHHDRRLGPDSPALTRAELTLHIWNGIKERKEHFPAAAGYPQPGHDSDGGGIENRLDGLPFDRDNGNITDRLDPDTQPN